MLLVDEEILNIVDVNGILRYFCTECDKPNFIGLYVNQSDKFINRAFESDEVPDKVEHKYEYDFKYAILLNKYKSVLYEKKCIADWEYTFLEEILNQE